MNKIVCKIVNLSIPNLANFAPWRESVPVFEHSRSPENLRQLRKILCIAMQRSQNRNESNRNISRKDAKRAKFEVV